MRCIEALNQMWFLIVDSTIKAVSVGDTFSRNSRRSIRSFYRIYYLHERCRIPSRNQMILITTCVSVELDFESRLFTWRLKLRTCCNLALTAAALSWTDNSGWIFLIGMALSRRWGVRQWKLGIMLLAKHRFCGPSRRWGLGLSNLRMKSGCGGMAKKREMACGRHC